jgi:addiction module RelE/StbE family toxin
MKIRWSPTAVSDLKSIRDYIAKDNPTAARKVAARIKEATNPGTRELVIPGTSYIAAYAVHDDGVEIAAVLHGKQDWPDRF